jgi:PadR family transcriptional regulator, regulatory protein PadR
MSRRRNEPNGQLDLLLMATIAGGPQHGYAIIQTLNERSGGRFAMLEGTVYPALHRLEELGLVASRSSEVGGRKRRVYELTALGTQALVERREAWDQFSAGVNAVLLFTT